ncbi:MAG: TauD/TfdA family dioxygenase [Myxococcota bacterium]
MSFPVVAENSAGLGELSAALEWQQGDIAILDSHLVMHGSRSFEGRRRVLVAFSARAAIPPPFPAPNA